MKLAESSNALDLVIETFSLFTFPEPISEADIAEWADDLSERAYSYAGLLVATVSRELAIAAPVLVPPFKTIVAEGKKPEVPQKRPAKGSARQRRSAKADTA